MNYDMNESGKRIQQLRIQRSYTQEGLAKELNIDRSFLSYIESGKKGISIDLLVQLSSILNASLDYIILGKEDQKALTLEQRRQLKEEIGQLVSILENFKALL